MSDPAVEAEKRANESNGEWPWNTTRDAMQEAAREALKPIRELHKPYRKSPTSIRLCAHDYAFWPCLTAELIYPEDELS